MIHRPGFTLIDTIIGFAISSLVMLIGITLIHRSMDLSHDITHECDSLRSQLRWVEQFRDDTHQAIDAHLDSTSHLKLLGNAGDWVEYRVEPTKATRFDSEGRREVLELTTQQSILFRRDVKLIVMEWTRKTPVSEPRMDRRAEALLGRSVALRMQGKVKP